MSSRDHDPIYRPVPSPPEEPHGLALAGGSVRFAQIEVLLPDAPPRLIPADAAPQAVLDRLTAKPPPFAGLPMAEAVLMGIVNVTPDSFSDGGAWLDPARAVAHGRLLAAQGAVILDIGGESTRPGADFVPAEEEIARVLPVIAALSAALAMPPAARETEGATASGPQSAGPPGGPLTAGPPRGPLALGPPGVPVLSVDTRKAEVARAAVAAGAGIVNDVSGLDFDPEMAGVVAETGVSLVLMHAQGLPATMQQAPRYDDVVIDVYRALSARVARAEAAGIPRARIAVDPGIGFGKTVKHNLALLRRVSVFHGLGCAVLLGVSRKRFIGTLGGEAPAAARDPGTLALTLAALGQGVQIHRIHAVAEAAQGIALWRAVNDTP